MITSERAQITLIKHTWSTRCSSSIKGHSSTACHDITGTGPTHFQLFSQQLFKSFINQKIKGHVYNTQWTSRQREADLYDRRRRGGLTWSTDDEDEEGEQPRPHTFVISQAPLKHTHTIYWSAHHAHPDLCLLRIGWSSGYHGRLAAGRLWVWLWLWLKLDLTPVQVYPTFLPGLLGPAPSALPSRTARFSGILRLLSHIGSKLDHLWSIPALYSPVETLLKRLTFKTIIFDLWPFLFLNTSVTACL